MEKNIPLWEDIQRKELDKKTFRQLDRDISVDVLVVGGGISGILCAYYLQKSNYNVCLCEKNKIGYGITKGTTAFVTAQHDTLYKDLIETIGKRKAKLYLDANLKAVKEYKELSEIYDFDYKTVDSCNYSLNDSIIVNKEYSALRSLGYNPKFVNQIPLPIKIKAGVVFPNQGQMNPLKLINELAKELTIYEDTEIIEIKETTAYTDKHKIRAKNIIIATHFPIVKNLGFSLKLYQERSYVITIKNKDELNGTYTEISDNGLYIRKYKDYLLIGGGDKKTGCEGDNYKKIYEFIEKNYSVDNITNYWGNQDCITMDGLPYIGLVKNNIYVITGFNQWGMTQSLYGALIIRDLISKKENRFAWVFNPKRCIINKALFKHIKSVSKNLINFKKKRCTHLGCALRYNDTEKSWDCPCHGSRFTESGEVINGPAKKNLKS